MRRNFARALVLAAYLMFVGVMSAAAAPPELLIDVDSTSAYAKEVRGYYSYRDHEYFAKPDRFKLVRVNLDLLKSDEPFVIRLFGNDVLMVRKISARSDSELYESWTGTILDPALETTDEHGPFTISISSGAIDRNTGTGETRNPLDSFAPDEVGDNAIVERLFAIEATIVIPFEMTTMSGEYRILPLAENPDYHLLMEVDPSKKLPWFDSEADALKAGPELRRRYEEQLEHKRSLGPDPRKLARDKWLNRARSE